MIGASFRKNNLSCAQEHLTDGLKIDMKLRIANKSVRFRILRSEVTKLIETGHIEETIFLGPGSDSAFSYTLETRSGLSNPQLKYEGCKVTVCIPIEEARIWAKSDQVGIYETLKLGVNGVVDLIVEKDFACLDRSDADNQDTFVNPQLAAAC